MRGEGVLLPRKGAGLLRGAGALLPKKGAAPLCTRGALLSFSIRLHGIGWSAPSTFESIPRTAPWNPQNWRGA